MSARRDRTPTAAHRDRAATAGRRERPSIRALAARSPRTVGLIAAAALFLTAMLVSMAMFSPDSSSAQTPEETRSGPATPTP